MLMLTAGQAPRGLAVTTTATQRAQGFGLFIGKGLLSELGFDSGGEERLTVQSGQQVTEAGKPTYDVEYKLDKNWSVIGEYDRFGDYDLDAKWKVYSR